MHCEQMMGALHQGERGREVMTTQAIEEISRRIQSYESTCASSHPQRLILGLQGAPTAGSYVQDDTNILTNLKLWIEVSRG